MERRIHSSNPDPADASLGTARLLGATAKLLLIVIAIVGR